MQTQSHRRVLGPKGKQYWHLSTGLRFRRFKWQWAVLCDYATDEDEWGNLSDWKPSVSTCDSRKMVRIIRRQHQQNPRARNIRIARRFVEVDWHGYNDSFGWNAGNGKR